MTTEADLYQAQVDLCRYWPTKAEVSCEEFLVQLKAGKARIEDCSFLTARQIHAFRLVLKAETYLPSVPQLTMPQPIEAGLFPVNEPNEESLVIVSGNSRLTFEVLATIWAQGVTPAYFLLVDCLGSTVDMAIVYGEFTPTCLTQALQASGLDKKVARHRIIIPGLAAPLVRDFADATNWEIEVGPVCAVELPLFLGDRWISPGL